MYETCIVDDDLIKLIDITYTGKMYLSLGSLLLKNFTIKHIWLRVVMR